MKRFVAAILCVIAMLGLAVPAAAENDVWPYLQTSQYCQSVSMAENRTLFLAAEQNGLLAPFTARMTAGILFSYAGAHGYDDPLLWASENGIMDQEVQNAPDQGLTRIHLALMLEAYLKYAEMILPEINERYYFNDTASMGAQAQETAAVMQRGGVMIEAADGNFYPFNMINISEGETILLRFFGGIRRQFMTMPVATVSESEPKDNAWFDDACFIGHSQVVGLRDYTNLTSLDYYAVIGHKVQDVLNERWYKMPTGRRGTLKNSLAAGHYGKVFIMLGVNDIPDKEKHFDDFIAGMRQLLGIVKETQPDAAVYILSLIPVGHETRNNLWFNLDNVTLYSQVLKNISREFEAEYIDVFRFLSDDTGYMLDEVNAGDGIHLIGAKYQVLADFIRSHTQTE